MFGLKLVSTSELDVLNDKIDKLWQMHDDLWENACRLDDRVERMDGDVWGFDDRIRQIERLQEIVANRELEESVHKIIEDQERCKKDILELQTKVTEFFEQSNEIMAEISKLSQMLYRLEFGKNIGEG